VESIPASPKQADISPHASLPGEKLRSSAEDASRLLSEALLGAAAADAKAGVRVTVEEAAEESKVFGEDSEVELATVEPEVDLCLSDAQAAEEVLDTGSEFSSPDPKAKVDNVTVEFNVSLAKGGNDSNGKSLGLKVQKLSEHAKKLTIMDVRKGLLQDWNMAHPRKEVQPRDCIVSVNGVQGVAEVLMAQMLTQSDLDLVVHGRRQRDSHTVVSSLPSGRMAGA
jgi:hypothetical protein